METDANGRIPGTEYLTSGQLAAKLQVHTSTIANWRKRFGCPHHVFGVPNGKKKTFRYVLAEVLAWRTK